MLTRYRNNLTLFLAALALVLCVTKLRAEDRIDTIKLDWAYYNPISLVLKDKGLLESDLKQDGVKVEWTQSLGSNKALELLRSRSIDFGSTAGAAALLARANGNPIKAIYVYSNPEWTALVTRPNAFWQP
jgi:sulfonate transport system substrate-binding protein